MKPGYEKTVQKYIKSHAHLADQLTLFLDAKVLRMKTLEGEETYSVKQLIEDGDKPMLEVAAGTGKLAAYSMTYELRQLGPDVIQFQNRHYDLDGFAWRRTGDA